MSSEKRENSSLPRRALGRAGAALAASSLVAAAHAEATDPPLDPPLDPPWTSSGYVAVGGGRMYWASVGEGTPLVMMPKLGGWIADFRHIAPALAQHFRIIAIDNPGHGESEMYGPPPYWMSLPESAAMVMATLDALGVNTCYALGNSLGGCILTVAAGLWPQKFEKLVLLSVALGEIRSRAELEEGDRKALGVNFDANGIPIPRDFEVVRKSFGVRDRSTADEQNASRAKAGLWIAPSERGVGHAGVVNYLPRITAETLLIYGAEGGYRQFEAPGKAGLKNVQSTVIPDAGSFTHQDNPSETVKALLNFLT